MKYEILDFTGKMNIAKFVENKIITMLTETYNLTGFKVDANVLTNTNSFEVNIKFESTPCRHLELEKYLINSKGQSHYWCKECHKTMDVKE